MPLTREKKEIILGELRTALSDAEAAVFVKFHGLTVAETGNLRKMLKEGKASYKVSKKTLLGKALDEKKYEGSLPELPGEVALVYTAADAIFPAKKIFEFSKGKEDKIVMLGGVLEGRYLTKEDMIALAKIPSREVLLSQLANVLLSPIQGFHGVLNNTLGGFVRVVGAISESRS